MAQKKTLSAKEVLKDIKGGMTDVELMEKYRLSTKSLQILFKKLVAAGLITESELDARSSLSVEVIEITEEDVNMATKTLNIKEVVKDIQEGMTNNDLLQKYQIAPEKLQRLFQKLLEAGAIQQSDLDLRNLNPPETRQAVKHTKQGAFAFICPACGMPQPQEYDVCPQCGVILAKFKEKQAKEYGKKLLREVRQLNIEAVKDLLGKGAYVDTQDRQGRTPLIIAASYGSTELVKLLLSKGADPSIKSVEGQTAFEVAQDKGENKIADLLRSYATPEGLANLKETPDQNTAYRKSSKQPNHNLKIILGVGFAFIVFTIGLISWHKEFRKRIDAVMDYHLRTINNCREARMMVLQLKSMDKSGESETNPDRYFSLTEKALNAIERQNRFSYEHGQVSTADYYNILRKLDKERERLRMLRRQRELGVWQPY